MEWTALLAQLEAGSPLGAGVVLVGLAWSTRRSVLASVRRFGERLGDVEAAQLADRHTAQLERARRWQLEAVLRRAGAPIPPWPDLLDVATPPPSRHAHPAAEWSTAQ